MVSRAYSMFRSIHWILRLLDPDRSARTALSEQVVAVELRNTIPDLPRTAAETSILAKLIGDRLDPSRTEGTSLAACAARPHTLVHKE